MRGRASASALRIGPCRPNGGASACPDDHVADVRLVDTVGLVALARRARSADAARMLVPPDGSRAPNRCRGRSGTWPSCLREALEGAPARQAFAGPCGHEECAARKPAHDRGHAGPPDFVTLGDGHGRSWDARGPGRAFPRTRANGTAAAAAERC